MKVFLIQQRKLEEIGKDRKILSASIIRIDKKVWMPLFEVMTSTGETVTCSLRVQEREEVRTWADVRLLAEFLHKKLGIEECRLVLKQWDSFQQSEPGETHGHF
ncbi:transcriptional regulator [Pseudomonas sp. Marseille-Q5115]|uniref:transcriptional regulator n=1 Tax=Pseudomonas sp. Marseille-Q5115 TaxID=2866593 RepID=UPI001CE46007|nr:transcriptional regulator [Pseudomonas sp. Marseille-Q5115]